MATVTLSRPIQPHHTGGIVDLTSPLSLETAIDTSQTTTATATATATTMTTTTTTTTTTTCPVPIPNKHVPVCPTGPALVQAPNTPPPSPGRDDSDGNCKSRRVSSPLYPPDRYSRLKSGSHSIFEIDADQVAAAIRHTAKRPLPDPSRVFPWFHGLHPGNHMQQSFFLARKKRVLRKTPRCLRGLTLVKADGNLCNSRLKGAIAPQEFLRPYADGEFIEMDPKEGFSVRNFHIQTAKTAATSDIIVYGNDAELVRAVGWRVASAQAKWREKHRAQGQKIPAYHAFICVGPFAEFERNHSEFVAVDSSGQLTGAVLDFGCQERAEMYAMSKASEISHNVWLGQTPEQGGEDEKQYDVLIECSDTGRLNPAALRTIAQNRQEVIKRRDVDFPASGSISAPTWSHAEADAILDTCKWIWHLSHGTLPVQASTDPDGDTTMSDASAASAKQVLRPRRVLIHCADGYTESTMLAIAYFSYSTGRPIPDAWLDLHTVKKRNFFAYPTDVALLASLAVRLLTESPVCADKSLSEITDMVRNEPKWFASLDGSLPSRILDYMYLGNLGHANNPDLLRSLGIKQILSVGETATWKEGELEAWKKENVMVIQGVQDNGIDPLTDEFERCLEFIDRGRRNATATLVHCRVGVSRSATICIAEVMRSLNLSFPRAYCFVRARRLNVIIQPHLRFAYELLKWEEVLRERQCPRDDDDVSELETDMPSSNRIGRELEWGEIAREIAMMNRPYAK